MREKRPTSVVYDVGMHPKARETEMAGKRQRGPFLRRKNTSKNSVFGLFSEVSQRKKKKMYPGFRGNVRENVENRGNVTNNRGACECYEL